MKNRYEVRGDVTVLYVPAFNGDVFECLIDTEDLELVDATITATWVAWSRPSENRWYVRADVYDGHGKPTCVWLHRLVTNAPKGKVVDHINHNTLDNRKSVLRVCTPAENMQNRNGARKNTKSGVRGVIWDESRNKWQARAKVNGKQYFLGRFDTIDEAEKVVVEFRKFHMPFSADFVGRRSG